MHHMEWESHDAGQYYPFEFEQVSINVINFGNNFKGFKSNCNVLFDEIDEPKHILTDLHIQGASNPKDCNPVSTKYQGSVLKCRFEVDSGAAGNLIPYNVFQEFCPGMPKSALKNSINQRTYLVDLLNFCISPNSIGVDAFCKLTKLVLFYAKDVQLSLAYITVYVTQQL